MTRQTLRPVTIARVIEICTLASNTGELSTEHVCQGLKVNSRRAKEILEECCDMKVVTRSKGGYSITADGRKLLRFFDREDWNGFRSFFHTNYPVYSRFLKMMRRQSRLPTGRTLDEMVPLGLELRHPLNRTALDVLSKLGERLGDIQRHAYSARFYPVLPGPKKSFAATFVECYEKLNVKSGVGLVALYVELPRLREDACERLKMSRSQFDELFLDLHRHNIGTIELSGAPVITSAKESPYVVRLLRRTVKEDMVAPKLDLEKERRGIDLLGRTYYYVAIHGKLSPT